MEPTSLFARAVTSTAHAAGASPLAATLSQRTRRGARARPTAESATQGFAIALRDDETLVIDVHADCSLQVLSGRAWITAEGATQDVFAGTESSVPLMA